MHEHGSVGIRGEHLLRSQGHFLNGIEEENQQFQRLVNPTSFLAGFFGPIVVAADKLIHRSTRGVCPWFLLDMIQVLQGVGDGPYSVNFGHPMKSGLHELLRA